MTDLNLINGNPGLSEAAPDATSEFATRGGAVAPFAGARRIGAIVTLAGLASRRPACPYILC
jgi:hypothetical protein